MGPRYTNVYDRGLDGGSKKLLGSKGEKQFKNCNSKWDSLRAFRKLYSSNRVSRQMSLFETTINPCTRIRFRLKTDISFLRFQNKIHDHFLRFWIVGMKTVPSFMGACTFTGNQHHDGIAFKKTSVFIHPHEYKTAFSKISTPERVFERRVFRERFHRIGVADRPNRSKHLRLKTNSETCGRGLNYLKRFSCVPATQQSSNRAGKCVHVIP